MKAPQYASQLLESTGYLSAAWFKYLTRKPAISDEKEIVNGSTIEIEHRLQRAPETCRAYLVCKTADLGYPVGRRVWLASFEDGSDYGISISADQEYLYVTVCANGIRLPQLSGSVGAFAGITNDRWRMVVVAD